MTTVVAVKVTPQGVLVPRPLIAALGGDVEEVEIEQRSDAIIIKPKIRQTSQLRAQILRKMKTAGLIEDLPWAQPPTISPEERARLAERLSHGKPLSEIIIENREQPA
jgi:antitoxin component of MazEF toxin-antitoxin module